MKTYFRNGQMIIVQNAHSYFPLLIEYVVTQERKIVNSCNEIERGASFTVIETNLLPLNSIKKENSK